MNYVCAESCSHYCSDVPMRFVTGGLVLTASYVYFTLLVDDGRKSITLHLT